MTDTDIMYFVVKNSEEQYSIWPADLDMPAGWTRHGAARAKLDCLAEIEKVWTDMRPASLRAQMDG